MSSVSVNAGDRWTPGVWPSDYRADDTNATAIIQTNLYALQRTEIYSLTAASSNGVSTNIPRYYDGKVNVGPFSVAPYGWTNIYYTRINDASCTNQIPVSSNAVYVYTSGVYVVSNAASYSATSGVYSFRANHIDLRTLDVQRNFNRRFEMYCTNQTAYIANEFPSFSNPYIFDERTLTTNLSLYKSEYTNLTWIKRQLASKLNDYADASKSDTNGLFGSYLSSSNDWTWINEESCNGATQTVFTPQWKQLSPQDFPRLDIEALVTANSNFPHTITTAIVTGAPGYVYGQVLTNTFETLTYTTRTYSTSWFDWTPHRAIGGSASNQAFGRVVSNQWTFDPWAMSTTNATTNYLWTASSNSTDWRVVYSANYDTNGSKTQACASVEFLTVPQYSGCVTTPTNLLTYGVLVTNSWIDEGFDIDDYGWKWVPFVFSNLTHLIYEPPYSITNWSYIDHDYENCGVTNICLEDLSSVLINTTNGYDLYPEDPEDYDIVLIGAHGRVVDQNGTVNGSLQYKKASNIRVATPNSRLDNSQADVYVFGELQKFDLELLQIAGTNLCDIRGYNDYPFYDDAYTRGQSFIVGRTNAIYTESFAISQSSESWVAVVDWEAGLTLWDYQFSSVEWVVLDAPPYPYDQVKGFGDWNITLDTENGGAIKEIIRFD